MGLSLEGSGLALDLDSDPFRHLDDGKGWGMPPVALQWFDGAGDGSVLRGGRTLRRTLEVPLLVRGSSPLQVDERLNRLARVLAPKHPARFRRTDPDGETWTLEVVREGGGDLQWGKDTDGRSWAQVTVVLTAGQPYWQRERASMVPIFPANANAGLIAPYSLTELRLASSQALGTVTLDNPGSAESPVIIQANGPAEHLLVVGPDGGSLEWNGTLGTGEWIRLERGRAYDNTGANRYHELEPAPVFWNVQPGIQAATVELTGAGVGTSVTVSWQPRKWVQFA